MSTRVPDPVRLRTGWPVPVASLLLTAWLGATLYFSVVVTRAAFAVLPSRAMAGVFVGQTVPALFDSGIVVGACLIVLALRSPRGIVRAASLAGGVVIASLSALARFVLLARIARLRLSMPADVDALALSDPARRAFGQLHAASVGALGLAMLAGILVVGVLVHSLSVVAHD